MIKKIYSTMITILMLSLMIVLPVSAQTDIAVTTSADVSANAEVVSENLARDLVNERAAKVRVAQLLRNVQANIEGGERIIQRLRNNSYEIDYDSLYSIIDRLELIAIELEEIDYSVSPKEFVRVFTEHKSDAVALTSEFRETLKELVPQEERDRLREEYQETRLEVRARFKDNIEQEKLELHIKQLEELALKFDIDASDLVSALESQDLTIGEARQRLAQLIREVNQEKRSEVEQRIREERARAAIEARGNAQEARIAVEARVNQREELLRQRLADRADRVEERIRNREVSSPTVSESLVNAKDRLDNLAQRRVNSLNDRIDKIENRPVACTREYSPVCAEIRGELSTFSNACVARSDGAVVQYEGECRADNQRSDISVNAQVSVTNNDTREASR